MKRPVNFETIDRVDFEMLGNSFHIELDTLQDKKETSWVWVFSDRQILGDYAILFELKWEHNCYSMKKCVYGQGTTGDYIFQDHILQNSLVETKDVFIAYIKQHISNEIKIKTFKN